MATDFTDSWNVGDLAVCVDARRNPFWPHSLVEGRSYTVIGVSAPDFCAAFNATGPALLLRELAPAPGSSGFAVERFRKVVADKQEPCEQEFVTLLKRSRVEA